MELNWEILPYSVPLRRPLLTAAGTWHERRGWFVRCSGGGAEGLGEVAPLPGWGSETLAQAEEALRAWPVSTPAPACVAEIASLLATRAAHPAVYAGLELALLDWLGRRAGVPVAALLGGEGAKWQATRETAALIGATPPAVAREQAQAFVDAGCHTLKIKLNGDADRARVSAVRAQVGPDVALRLDVNALWPNVASALAALLPFADLRPEFIEQPLPAHDIAGLGRLAAELPFPVAADEALGLPGACEALLQARVPVWVCKPMATGGLLAALAWRRRAEAQGVRLVWSSVLDLGIASLGVLHLAALDTVPAAVGLGTAELFAAAHTVPELRPVAGRLHVPAGAGLGVRQVPAVLANVPGGVT